MGRRATVVLLAIETTCDETAAAVLDLDGRELGSVVATQDELHRRYGGVVPEIASRAHLERIVPVIDEALRRSQRRLADIQAVAVAHTPGLAGSLLVGLAAAKALCVALDVPLLGVNHVHAHLYACRLAAGYDIFPAVGLVVSGGHTHLYDCRSATDFRLLGGTIDDAAGEAFDKVASLLGLGYPGGPAIQKAAEQGNRHAYEFPRSFVHEPGRLQFSFSGLKTAVRYAIAPASGPPPDAARLDARQRADLAASFQEAVVDALLIKTHHALAHTGHSAVCVGGGVAANRRLRERLTEMAQQQGWQLHIAPPELCTDNAVMGALALERLRAGQSDPLDLDIRPGLLRGEA